MLVVSAAAWVSCGHRHDDRPSADNSGATNGTTASGGSAADAGAAGADGGGGAAYGGAAGADGSTNATTSTTVDAGGSVGAGRVPAGWTCTSIAYGDGACDCGCGALDPDCSEASLDTCEQCNGPGSCSFGECPGHIDPDDVAKCVAPPAGWTCAASAYHDGATCDCGCGVRDEDCEDGSATSCDNCSGAGSCAQGPCPSAVMADDNSRCSVPPEWDCPAEAYGDGVCNCGCNAVDVDCPDANATSCVECDGGCSPFACEFYPDDNAHCPEPPAQWSCSDRLYADGSRCDCGCGAIDPDCDSLNVDDCDKCDAPGSCSAHPCPGIIETDFNGRCDQPVAPAGWTCPGAAYGDGLECDCGCGVPDIDCATEDYADCQRCPSCGGIGACAGMVDSVDTTQCAPPPSGWTCSAAAYRDLACDCGCGVLDPHCQGIPLFYVCERYPVEGCTAGNRTHLDPNDNTSCRIEVPDDWTCDRSYFDDGLCDCGCGAVDLDCPSNDVSVCEACDDVGSCSSDACPGEVTEDDSAHCSP